MKSFGAVTPARTLAKLLSIPSEVYRDIAGLIWRTSVIKDGKIKIKPNWREVTTAYELHFDGIFIYFIDDGTFLVFFFRRVANL